MLTFDGLKIRQGDFSLSADARFSAGCIAAVMGASGAGKSTLLGAVAGFSEVAEGSISWDGSVISDLPPGRRPVSILFQDNNLFPHLTVAQNIALGVAGKTTAPAVVIAQALDAVDLAGFENRKPAQLSGGQQSRVGIARMLVSKRPVLLLDEPFAALGPALKTEMLALTRRILADERGITVLMVTHDPSDAQSCADTVAWIEDGRLTPPRPTAEVFADPPDGMKTYLGAMG